MAEGVPSNSLDKFPLIVGDIPVGGFIRKESLDFEESVDHLHHKSLTALYAIVLNIFSVFNSPSCPSLKTLHMVQPGFFAYLRRDEGLVEFPEGGLERLLDCLQISDALRFFAFVKKYDGFDDVEIHRN